MAADKVERIREVNAKLELLGCPYVENVDETWLSELLFKPGEPRLRLLQWLLGRFDPHVEELLESTQAVRVINIKDSRVARLLFCSNLLGLCHNEDVDLITRLETSVTSVVVLDGPSFGKGSSSKSKQLAFFEELIEMAHRALRADTLDKDFSDGCKYLDLLCRQEDLGDVFKEKIQLFPPDIEKQFEKKADNESKSKSHIPEVTHLASMALQIGTELKKQNRILERIQSNSWTPCDAQTMDRVSRTMTLTLSTLTQMTEGFTHCYETEMKPWSAREKPRLSELGPVFKRVSLLLEKFLEILNSVEKLKTSNTQISRLKSVEMESNLVPLGKVALTNLQECLGILDEALKRRSDILNDTDSL